MYYFLTLLVLIILILLFIGMIVSSLFTVNDIELPYKGSNNLTMIQLSDIHIKRANDRNLSRSIKIINSINPDIVLISGDLYDFGLVKQDVLDSTIRLLSSINVKHRIAIYGNHDVHPDTVNAFEETMRKADFKLVRDDFFKIEGINFFATDSIYNNNMITKPIIDKDVDNLVVLAHEPDTFIVYKKDLRVKYQISGHSHNGQVALPFIGAIKRPLGAKYYWKSNYKERKKELYVCYGIGNSQKNIRLYVKRTINLYTFKA